MTLPALLNRGPVDGYVSVAPRDVAGAARSKLATAALTSDGAEAVYMAAAVMTLGRRDAYTLSRADARHINRIVDFPDQPDWDWSGVFEEDE